MKILIAGLGSVGLRHARNLRTIRGDAIDLLAYRVRGGGGHESTLGIRSFTELDRALAERPDAVIVANPSSLHLEVAAAAADAGCHLFVEKPLADGWDGVERLVERVETRGLVATVGYHFRFHPALIRVRRMLDAGAIGRTMAARFTFGEYLPGWHPDEDYRQSYAARRALGGGVLLTQIHDLDIAYWFWGLPARAFAVGGHRSRLDVDVEDVASVTLAYADGAAPMPVHLHMDYLQRPPARRGEIIGETGRLTFDLIEGRVDDVAPDGRVETHDDHVDRNELFVREMRHFLDCLEGRATPDVTLRDGAASLAMALAARASMASGESVAVRPLRPARNAAEERQR